VHNESSFELVARAQAGDASAFNALIERYRPRLQRWATGRLGYARDMADTEDIVQDVLIGAFRNIQSFENRGEWALQKYLRTAVTNRIRTEVARVRNRPRREDEPEDLPSQEKSPLEQAVGSEFLARYDAALERLSEPEREAVIARLELGCSYQEIALLLEKSTPDAARMIVNRAVEKLGELLSTP
jgi:RNA polymerase sigma-70 factor (ECF subfamily)